MAWGRITLHQKIGKGIKLTYITSKNTLKNVSGIQNVIIYVGTVVGKCSATRYSVAAPPPGSRHDLGGPMHPRQPPAVAEREVRQGPWGGGVAATPLLHTQNCRMSRDRGVATPWSATGGVCSVCPTKPKITCFLAGWAKVILVFSRKSSEKSPPNYSMRFRRNLWCNAITSTTKRKIPGELDV